jgi:hypothetical protein
VAPLSGSDHEHRIGRLEKDMWHGNGKPGLTTRMQQAEDAIKMTGKCIDEVEREAKESMRMIVRRQEGTDRKFWAIILLLLTLLGGLTLDLIKTYSAIPERHQITEMY